MFSNLVKKASRPLHKVEYTALALAATIRNNSEIIQQHFQFRVQLLNIQTMI